MHFGNMFKSLKPLGVNQSTGSAKPKYHPIRSTCAFQAHDNLTNPCQTLRKPQHKRGSFSPGIELFVVHSMALIQNPTGLHGYSFSGIGLSSTVHLLPITDTWTSSGANFCTQITQIQQTSCILISFAAQPTQSSLGLVWEEVFA